MNPSSHQTEQQKSQLVFGQPSEIDFSRSKNLTPAPSIDELKGKGEIKLIAPLNRKSLAPTIHLPNVFSHVEDQYSEIEPNKDHGAPYSSSRNKITEESKYSENNLSSERPQGHIPLSKVNNRGSFIDITESPFPNQGFLSPYRKSIKAEFPARASIDASRGSILKQNMQRKSLLDPPSDERNWTNAGLSIQNYEDDKDHMRKRSTLMNPLFDSVKAKFVQHMMGRESLNSADPSVSQSRKLAGDIFLLNLLESLEPNEDEDEENSEEEEEDAHIKEIKALFEEGPEPVPEEDGLLKIVELDDFEKLHKYKDNLPFLEQRKKIRKLMKTISYICRKVVKNPVFEYICLVVIILNTLSLVIQDPLQPEDSTLSQFDDVFLIAYTIEMVLKIFALGFLFNKRAYLRDYWNILDFVIVVTAYIPIVIPSNGNSGPNLSGLRALRVLRPLRTISSIKALKVLLMTLFSALNLLVDTLIVLLFFFMIFAIAGLQLFSGLLKKRCFDVDTGKPYPGEVICGYVDCPTDVPGVTYICGKMIANPSFDVMSFDTIFYALLQVFQSVTLEGWSDIMIGLEKAFSPFVVLYFVFLVFLGAFFLLNLTLAVIKTKYTQSTNDRKESDGVGSKIEVEPVMQVREYKILRRRVERKQEIYRQKRGQVAPEVRLNFAKGTNDRTNDSREASPFLKSTASPDTFTDTRNKNISNFEGINFTKLNSEINEAKDKTSRFITFRPENDSKSGTPRKIHVADETSNKNSPNCEKAGLLKNNRKVYPLNGGKMLNEIKVVGKDQDTVNKFRMKFFGMIGLQETPDVRKKKDSNVPTQTKFAPDESFERLSKLETAKPLEDENKDFSFRENNKVIELVSVKSHLANSNSKESARNLLSHVRPQNNESMGTNSEANGVDSQFNEEDNLFDQEMLPKQLSHIDRLNKRKKQIVPPLKKPRPGQINYAKQGSNTSSSFKLSRTGTIKSYLAVDENIPTDLLDDNQAGVRKDTEILAQLEDNNTENQSFPLQDTRNVPEILSTSQPLNKGPETSTPPLSMTSTHHRKSISQPWDVKRSAKHTTMRKQSVLGVPKRKSGIRSSVTSSRRSTILLRAGNKASFFKKMKEYDQQNSLWGRIKLRLTKIWEYVSAKSSTDLDDSFVSDESESAEIEEKYSKVDFSQLKFHIEHSREYASESVDDVLDERCENEQREKRRREEEMFRKTKFQMVYQLKRDDHDMDYQTGTSDGKTSYMGGSKSRSLDNNSLSRGGSVQGDAISRQASDRRISTAAGVATMNVSDKDGDALSRGGSTVGRRRRRKKRAEKEKRQPDDFKMDYAVLHKLFETKFENENDLYVLSQEVGFTNPLDYGNIKRDDLKSFSISKLNWSGNDVSRTWYNEKMDRAKQAIMFQERVVWLPGYIGVLKIIKKKIADFVNGKFFENFLTLVVVGNTIILASDGLVDEDNQTVSTFSNLFTGIFIVEMSCKLIGLGINEYVRDKMNIFDGVIVLLSVAEWTVLSGGAGKAVSAFRTVRIFRTFRVLRVTRLLRALDFMQVIIHVVSTSLSSFTYIALLLILFIFIYALLGMQLFAGELQNDKMGFRQNFDSFGRAFLAVFQILTLENWGDILTTTMNSDVNKFITVFYLFSWIFIGNYVFLNLFLAILLDGFTEEGIDEVLKKKKEIDEDYLFYHANNDNMQTEQKSESVSDVDLSFDSADFDLDESVDASKKKQKKKEKPLYDNIHCDKSWWLFSKRNPIRKLTGMIVRHRYFESVILVTIVLSSLKLVVDTYIPDNPVADSDIMLKDVSDKLDIFFNVFFAVEFLLKAIYMGFIIDRNSYLRENWNRLDFFIVVSSLIDMIFEDINLPIIKILRLLRTLRPLRFISHNINMKIMVTALLESFSAMLNVVIVVVLVWLMFAILGISLMKGRLGYCTAPALTSSYGVSRSMCDSMGGTWNTYNANYENIFEAMMTLFVVSSLEGWPDIMYQAIDSGTDDSGPQKDGSPAFAGYYIGFILIGSFFFVNLFVGVIFYQFTRAQKNEQSKTSRFLGEDQQKWIEMQKLILSAKPKDPFIFAPKAKFSKYFQRIITHKLFDPIIMVAIVLNIVVMAMSYDDSSTAYQDILDNVNLVFTVIFMLEMVLKLLALGPKGYWFNGWNRFDAFVVIASIVDLLLDSIGSELGSFLRVGPQLARVLRVLRVSRLFRLAKSLQGLAALIETMIFSLPSMLNITALLFLVFFIYSVLGVFLYHDITKGVVINDLTNFANFGNAMVALFRSSTGENWHLLMFDTMKTEPNCTPKVDCGTPWSVLYFLSFIVLLQFIMLNMFILIILQNFDEYYFKPDNPIKRFKENVEAFSETWTKKTRHSRGAKISKNQLIPFFTDLEPPLGMKGTPRNLIAKAILQMNLVGDVLGNVYFNELLFAAMKRAYGEKLFNTKDPELLKYLAREEFKTKARIEGIKAKFQHQKFNPKDKKRLTKGGGVNPLVEMLFVGMTLRAWRNYVPKYQEQKMQAELQGIEFVEPPSEDEEEEEVEETEEDEREETAIEHRPIEIKSSTKPKIEMNDSDSESESEEEPVFELEKKDERSSPKFVEGLFQKSSAPTNSSALSRRLSQAFYNLRKQGLFDKFSSDQDQKKQLSFLKQYLKAQEQFTQGDKAISLEDVEKKRELAIKTIIIPHNAERESPRASKTNLMRQKSLKRQDSFPKFMRQGTLQQQFEEHEDEAKGGRINLFKRCGTLAPEDEEQK